VGNIFIFGFHKFCFLYDSYLWRKRL
jgi:hypothetical protein